VLGLFGGADQAIPTDQVESYDAALDEAGVEHEIHVYPGAPHSFFDKKQDEFAEESGDAWRRVIRWLAALPKLVNE
jgi:carboxymethylenebutenolidase